MKTKKKEAGITLSKVVAPPPTGFALCCGQAPSVSWIDKRVTCGTCGSNVGVYQDNGFLRSCWNHSKSVGSPEKEGLENLRNPALFLRESWFTADVSLQHSFFGGNKSEFVQGCLFTSELPPAAWIPLRARHVPDIMLEHWSGARVRIQWPNPKKDMESSVHVCAGESSDGTFTWSVFVHCTSQKKWKLLQEWLNSKKG